MLFNCIINIEVVMNKKGFTLIELLAVLIILGLIMILVFPSLNLMSDDTNSEKYIHYENMMAEYAESYHDNNKTYYDLETDFGNDLLDIKRECEGYVKVVTNGGIKEYKPYIKCSDYKTSGYSK